MEVKLLLAEVQLASFGSSIHEPWVAMTTAMTTTRRVVEFRMTLSLRMMKMSGTQTRQAISILRRTRMSRSLMPYL